MAVVQGRARGYDVGTMASAPTPDSSTGHTGTTGTELLRLQGLTTRLSPHGGDSFAAVNGVDLHVDAGESVAVVGESGCGKTMLALSILGLVPWPVAQVADGQVWLQDKELTALPEEQLRRLRGRDMSMIFQEPMTALNPVFTVGEQVAEVLRQHKGFSRTEAHRTAVAMLSRVHIPDAQSRAAAYPHELSGGLRQRVVIAMALACGPALLLADEPTTALDVTIQAAILDLLAELRSETQMGVLLITHDLGVVASACSRAYVMYAGRVVEHASVTDLFATPRHPYTQGLMGSLPGTGAQDDGGRLTAISGTVPPLADLPPGCPFHPRCPRRFEACDREVPGLYPVGESHARCLLYRGEASA